MTNGVKVNTNLHKLHTLLGQLGHDNITKVGVLAKTVGRTDNSEFNNAEIGVVQEFGSATKNIPPRSFLRMPLETKSADIEKYLDSAEARNLIKEGKIKTLFQRMGFVAEDIIDQSFKSNGFGKWIELKPETIKAKGSDKALIDTRQLQRSITSEVSGK